MTREEALRILSICKDAVETESFITAIDMAISALEREEADGCVGCLYEDLYGDEEPCNECKNNYTNEWKSKVSHEEQTEPSDLIRQETIKELGEWLEQMIQHGVPSYSAKRKTLANAIVLLSMNTHEFGRHS